MSILPAAKRRRLSPAEGGVERTTNSFYENASKWKLEEAYEQRVTKQKKKDKKSDKLPIKRGGQVEQAKEAEQVEEDDLDGVESSRPPTQHAGTEDVNDAEEPVEDSRPLKEQILEAKEDLAKNAGLLSEDPEEHIGQLKSLAKIGQSRHPTIRKLAMATQLSVFKDLIPGYRIRPVAEADMKAKLSRDVKRLRNFEQTLVTCYRDYVQGLGKATKIPTRDVTPAQVSIASMAYTCACTLLDSVPHFNFRSDLLNILVTKLTSRQLDDDAEKCRAALETLFENDEDGNASLEAVSLLTKMLKSKDYNVHEAVLNTFLNLRLLSEYSYRASTTQIDKSEEAETVDVKRRKKDREFRTKKQRKMFKEQKAVDKEMKEADAVVSHEERDKNQSEMLKLVFIAYFRILKQRRQNLMGAVLEGLARYAHLINQDFFGDILESLRDLISRHASEDEETGNDAVYRDKAREALLCTVTAFALLQGQDASKSASTLHLDLSFFTKQLYNTALPLSLDPSIETAKKPIPTQGDEEQQPEKKSKVNVQTPSLLMLRSVTSLLLPPQQARSVPPTLLAAFTKRLMTASLQLPEKSALAMLGLVKQVVKVHGNKISGLWYTEERRGDGVFDVERDEWGSANPFATNIWEGELLRMHWSEKVKAAAKEVQEAVSSRRS